jgi:RecA-family ATPase
MSDKKAAVECIGWTVAELLETEFPEQRWAIPGILPEGLSIIGGKPKMGKSILAGNISLSVATGGKALGCVDVERGGVLYLALEDTGRRLKSRIKQMTQHDPGAKKLLENFHIFTSWPKMGAGGLRLLREKIKAIPDFRLFIVDTLQAFKPVPKGKSNNQYEIDYENINRIKKEVADDLGAAGVIVHHVRKMGAIDVFDTFSGTFGITGAADNLLVLSKKGRHSELAIRGRDIEEKAFALEFDKSLLCWNITGDAEEIQGTRNEQAVFDCLKNNQKILSLQQIEKMTGVKYKTIQKVMKKLEEQPKILKIDRGQYIYNEFLTRDKGDKGDKGDKRDIGDIPLLF